MDDGAQPLGRRLDRRQVHLVGGVVDLGHAGEYGTAVGSLRDPLWARFRGRFPGRCDILQSTGRCNCVFAQTVLR
jgi:hypothetical protein